MIRSLLERIGTRGNAMAFPAWIACEGADFETEAVAAEIAAIREPVRHHRKQWEYAYVLSTARRLGLIAEGRRALGFGVGQEPVPAVLAASGMQVLATDRDRLGAAAMPLLRNTLGQPGHARYRGLNNRNILAPDLFDARVDFRFHDILGADPLPEDGGRDLVWSCGVLHHLGSAAAVEQAIGQSVARLAPGGWALHTFDVAFGEAAGQTHGALHFLALREAEALHARFVRAGGRAVGLGFRRGKDPADRDPELSGSQGHHVCVRAGALVIGSIGIAVPAPVS